jgi:hypothetical protein
MKRLLQMLLTTGMACSLAGSSVNLCFAQSADDEENPSAQMLRGQIEGFGVLSDEILNKMGFKVSTGESRSVVVSEVRSGTAASDCGIQKGDLVLDAHVQDGALNVTIERDGSIFRARLRELHVNEKPTALVAEVAKKDNRPTKPFTLNAAQFAMPDNQLVAEKAKADPNKPLSANTNRFALEADKNFKVLANYNVELLVDRSMSMKALDCPDGLSRWGWCGQQAADLAKSLAPYTPTGLTIVPFATEYDVFGHATAQNIDYLFNSVQLQNGTRLFEPLAERLDDYFVHHKPDTRPLLIVVVTDGMPVPKFEPALVRNELIKSSQKMTSSGEVTVIFCQIGGKDRAGQQYLLDLDQNLVSEGARYHYVHTISFDELQEAGLGPAVAASINQYAPASIVPKPSSAAKPKPAPVTIHARRA